MAHLHEIEKDIWAMLLRSKSDKKHPYRYPVLSTFSEQFPEARTVVLRQVNPKEKSIEIYTDARTPKIQQLVSKPKSSFTFYHPKSKIQLRCNAIIDIHINDAYSKHIWNTIDLAARNDYLSVKPPSSYLLAEESSSQSLDLKDSSFFCILKAKVVSIDYLKLSREGHQRALFKYDAQNNFVANWLIP